ncbi:hypothetical protein TSMEX_011619 [Taenia solium]
MICELELRALPQKMETITDFIFSRKIFGSGLNVARCGSFRVHYDVDRKHQSSVRVESAAMRREELVKS